MQKGGREPWIFHLQIMDVCGFFNTVDVGIRSRNEIIHLKKTKNRKSMAICNHTSQTGSAAKDVVNSNLAWQLDLISFSRERRINTTFRNFEFHLVTLVQCIYRCRERVSVLQPWSWVVRSALHHAASCGDTAVSPGTVVLHAPFRDERNALCFSQNAFRKLT